MLDQVIRWVQIAGIVADALFLLRLLQLRLHRIYQFIAAFGAIGLLIDAAVTFFGAKSHETEYIFTYSLFLNVIIFPLAAWDSFESVPVPLQGIRRPLLSRLVTGMTFMAFVALLLTTLEGDQISGFDKASQMGYLLWVVASTSCMTFLWGVRRFAKMQHVELTGNTVTLSAFLMIYFAAEVFGAFIEFLPRQAEAIASIVQIALAIVQIGVTLWCVVRLRTETEVAEPNSVGA